MPKIKDRYIKFGQSQGDTNDGDIPSIFSSPINFTPTSVASTGTDKVAAYFSGIDTALGSSLLLNGTRAMSGNLNMNTNAIINVSTVNGVTVQSHASRHLPSGADPLATSAPVSTGTANSIGTANSFARADHVHNTVVPFSHVMQTGEVQSNATNDILLNGMTLTPPAGSYIVYAFAQSQHLSNTGITTYGLFSNGSLVANTQYAVNRSGSQDGPGYWMACAEITVNGSQAIEIRWRTQSGTARTFGRFLSLIKRS